MFNIHLAAKYSWLILWNSASLKTSDVINMQLKQNQPWHSKHMSIFYSGVLLTYLPEEDSPGGRDPGLRTGELAGLQSSGNGLGMAGRDDVLSCCSSSCNLLKNGKRSTLYCDDTEANTWIPAGDTCIINFSHHWTIISIFGYHALLFIWGQTVWCSEQS